MLELVSRFCQSGWRRLAGSERIRADLFDKSTNRQPSRVLGKAMSSMADGMRTPLRTLGGGGLLSSDPPGGASEEAAIVVAREPRSQKYEPLSVPSWKESAPTNKRTASNPVGL